MENKLELVNLGSILDTIGKVTVHRKPNAIEDATEIIIHQIQQTNEVVSYHIFLGSCFRSCDANIRSLVFFFFFCILTVFLKRSNVT